MRGRFDLLFLGFLVVGSHLSGVRVRAYVPQVGLCNFDPYPVHWLPDGCPASSCSVGSIAHYEVCGATDTPAKDFAAGWGFWMWVRESALRTYHYWEQSFCHTEISWGNAPNNFDFISYSPSVLGTSASVYACTFSGPLHAHQQSGDIRINESAGSSDVMDSIAECVVRYNPWDDTFMHEQGHSMGLAHNNSYPTLMKGANGASHMCNIGAGIRGQPHADDQAGVAAHVGRNTANLYNLSGMAFYGTGSTSEFIDASPDFISPCSSYQISASMTLMNYYKVPDVFNYQIVLIPQDVFPDSGSIAWASRLFSRSVVTTGMTERVVVSVGVPGNSLAPNRCYRAFVRVDPTGLVGETDEGDNLFPLGRVVCTNPSC